MAKNMNKVSRENSERLRDLGFISRINFGRLYWCPTNDGSWIISGTKLNEDDVVAAPITEALSWLFSVHKIDFNFEHTGTQERGVITYNNKSHFTEPVQGFHELLDSVITKSIEVIMKNP
jgi:hypothetical protein